MRSLQNEYRYKAILNEAVNKAIDEITEEESNELEWIPEHLVHHMTEAAWVVLKANIDTQDFLRKEGHLKD